MVREEGISPEGAATWPPTVEKRATISVIRGLDLIPAHSSLRQLIEGKIDAWSMLVFVPESRWLHRMSFLFSSSPLLQCSMQETLLVTKPWVKWTLLAYRRGEEGTRYRFGQEALL